MANADAPALNSRTAWASRVWICVRPQRARLHHRARGMVTWSPSSSKWRTQIRNASPRFAEAGSFWLRRRFEPAIHCDNEQSGRHRQGGLRFMRVEKGDSGTLPTDATCIGAL